MVTFTAVQNDCGWSRIVQGPCALWVLWLRSVSLVAQSTVGHFWVKVVGFAARLRCERIELYNSCLGGHPCDWLFHHSWQAFALPVGFVRYVYFGVVTFVASRLVLLLQAFALLQKVKIFGCGHLCVQPCCLAGLCAVICGSGPEHNSSDLLDESQQSVIETLDWH